MKHWLLIYTTPGGMPLNSVRVEGDDPVDTARKFFEEHSQHIHPTQLLTMVDGEGREFHIKPDGWWVNPPRYLSLINSEHWTVCYRDEHNQLWYRQHAAIGPAIECLKLVNLTRGVQSCCITSPFQRPGESLWE